MKSQSDCWRAILEGKTLVSELDTRVKLIGGEARDDDGCTYGFSNPENWKILEEPLYFYQWERLYDGRIYTSGHISDEEAEIYGYADRGYRKIESSKRTWED